MAASFVRQFLFDKLTSWEADLVMGRWPDDLAMPACVEDVAGSQDEKKQVEFLVSCDIAGAAIAGAIAVLNTAPADRPVTWNDLVRAAHGEAVERLVVNFLDEQLKANGIHRRGPGWGTTE